MAWAPPKSSTEVSLDVTSDEWDWQPLVQYRELPNGAFLVRVVRHEGGQPKSAGVFRTGDHMEVHYEF